MHGGTSPGAPKGNRHAWKHGRKCRTLRPADRILADDALCILPWPGGRDAAILLGILAPKARIWEKHGTSVWLLSPDWEEKQMPKSKPTGIKPPNVKAIATRAERAKPRPAGLSARERAAEARRLAADEKRLRTSLAKSMDVAALERFAREREKSDLKRAKAAHRRPIAASSDRAKWLAMQSVPANVLAPADGEEQFTVDTALFMRAWPNTRMSRNDLSSKERTGRARIELVARILVLAVLTRTRDFVAARSN